MELLLFCTTDVIPPDLRLCMYTILFGIVTESRQRFLKYLSASRIRKRTFSQRIERSALVEHQLIGGTEKREAVELGCWRCSCISIIPLRNSIRRRFCECKQIFLHDKCPFCFVEQIF